MSLLRSSCEKEWAGHWSFAAKAIASLFAVFKAWRCDIMYGEWRAQVLTGSTPRWSGNSLLLAVQTQAETTAKAEEITIQRKLTSSVPLLAVISCSIHIALC